MHVRSVVCIHAHDIYMKNIAELLAAYIIMIRGASIPIREHMLNPAAWCTDQLGVHD